METFNATGTVAAFSAGVQPAARKLVAESWSAALAVGDQYSPQDVHVSRVTGGFNSVVQVSAAYCLRSYAEHIDASTIVARQRGAALATTLAQLHDDLTDPFWATFVPDPNRLYGIGYSPVPVSLLFSAPDSVSITFHGDIALMVERIVVKPPVILPQGPPGTVPLEVPVAPLQGNFGQFQPSPNPSPPPALPPGGSAPTASHPPFLRGDFSSVLATSLFNAIEVPMLVQQVLGTVEITLRARLRGVEHPAQKTVEVLLDLSHPEITAKPEPGDAKVLYKALLERLEPLLAVYIAPQASIPLTPTLSLVGRNGASASVPELPEFAASVFPVFSRSRQAVCAAFDVVPGCKGIIEAVEHFIGDSDYGVIHDNYVVERVMHHKWNRGGFDRSLALTRKISLRVKRDGHDRDEDAWVYGRLVLNSLDEVSLQPHADLRGDLLLFRGQAEGVADRVVLTADGTVLTPANADLGPPEAATWAVNAAASLTVPWEPDPELRDFRTKAHSDGVRHLARPFARFPLTYPAPEVQYVRTEAILKRMFFLGQLPGVFA